MKVLLLIFSAILLYAEAHKILVVFPLPGKSHGILGAGFVRHLLNAGHEVTSILPYERKPHPKLTQIIPNNSAHFSEDYLNIKLLMDKVMDLSDIQFVQSMMYNVSKNTMVQEPVQELLKDPKQKFDLVIAEWMFSEMYAVFSVAFNCPYIWFSTVEPHWQVMRLIDEPMNPAYTTNILGSAIPPYSFSDRLRELWLQAKIYYRVREYNALENELYQDIIVPIAKQRGYPVPDYDDLIHNASLMFGNSHYSMGLAPKLPQSYKPIGGYHIEDNVAPLPEDLKEILDNAKNGLIYFSMGSNLKSKYLPPELKDGILKVFSELKQTVLWKFEEPLPNLPKNVHILPWAPQPSILAHPNTILFITHGGLLSTTEVLHYGKPLIGIPVFADQFGNVEKAVHKGFARHVELSYTMDEQMRVEIKEILGNPKYAEKAKEWSELYHDRLVPPEKELNYWVDHVVKRRGAPHLRSPALMVPWYQRLYLDLLAFVIVAILFLLNGSKAVYRTISRSSSNKGKKKKNA